MIGMMYLVLTALLAMNVSKDVLNAFINVDHGINKTLENFMAKNESVYLDFAAKSEVNPEKVGPYYQKAMEVKKEADELYEMIHKYKEEIVSTSEGKASPALEGDFIDLELVQVKDNTDVPAQIMVTQGKGKILKEKIEHFREKLEEMVGKENKTLFESIHKSLDTHDHKMHDGSTHSWESSNFEHLPLAGVIAIMSGLQTNIRNVESEVVNYLYSQIDAGSFKFNRLDATVIPNTNYVIKGNEYRAEIFLAASDTTQEPVVLLGNYEETVTEDGTVKYEMVGKYDIS
ncbi:MAG: hypothetical protein HC896_00515 [Bacteroidales bacterium]|nr:hypothetical protein [Bacteroidales bacterium]